MADLQPNQTRLGVDSTVAATRSTSPAETLQNTINDKELNKTDSNAVTLTRTVSKDEAVNATGGADDENDKNSHILTGRRLLLVHSGFLGAVLLFALDQTIVATALPVLASKFNALDQLTWVVSAYFCKLSSFSDGSIGGSLTMVHSNTSRPHANLRPNPYNCVQQMGIHDLHNAVRNWQLDLRRGTQYQRSHLWSCVPRSRCKWTIHLHSYPPVSSR